MYNTFDSPIVRTRLSCIVCILIIRKKSNRNDPFFQPQHTCGGELSNLAADEPEFVFDDTPPPATVAKFMPF